MQRLYLVFLIALGWGCSNDHSKDTYDELSAIREEVAALSDSISALKDSLRRLQVSDTIQSPIPKDTILSPTPAEKSPAPQEKTQKTSKPNPKPSTPVNDTIIHKYTNGSTSVKITPWADGKRDVILYDLYGNETYRMEEVRHSYSISVELKFAGNGSVKQAIVHTNPGASMYWYESEITFDTINGPIGKIDHKFPQTLEDIMTEKWQYWDKKSKSWKVQETME